MALRQQSERGQQPAPAVPASKAELHSLRQEVEDLRKKVGTLEGELEVLSNFVENMSAGEQVVVLRELSREQAKQEIKELFEGGEVLYYSDVSQRLRIDLPLVVELCAELMDAGEVIIDGDNANKSG